LTYSNELEDNNEDVWKDKYFDELERSYKTEQEIREKQILLENFFSNFKKDNESLPQEVLSFQQSLKLFQESK